MLGNFLGTICWETFWKLYAGNLMMETMCWEIRVDAGGFLNWGNYGTQLRHHTTDLRQWLQARKLSLPAVQTFLEQSEASKVIGSVEQGDGDAQQMLVISDTLMGKHDSGEVNRKALA